MSDSALEILVLSQKFEEMAEESLIKSAKEKEKKKLDPKAKVRNRGTVCVPASSAKDKKDHFPINNIDQARNALARVHQYSSVPEWYKGSLKGLQALVSRKVHSKYPAIGKEKSSKKSSVESLISKYSVPEALQLAFDLGYKIVPGDANTFDVENPDGLLVGQYYLTEEDAAKWLMKNIHELERDRKEQAEHFGPFGGSNGNHGPNGHSLASVNSLITKYSK